MKDSEKQLEKSIENVFARLKAIKEIVDKNKYTTITTIRKEIKGAAVLYDFLSRERILYKNPHDNIVYWDIDTKVSKNLARRMALMLKEKNKSYVAKNTTEPTPSLNKTKKPAITKTTDSGIKPKFKLGLFWGLFTFEKK